MVIGLQLPDGITPAHVETLLAWVRKKAAGMRPWIQTYVMAESAKEGIEVEGGVPLAVFDAVMEALHNVLAWPDMSAETLDGARRWYTQESSKE